jgi:hypothetical protein
MTLLRKIFFFNTKRRIVSYWRPKLNRSVSSLTSFGEGDSKDFGKNYDVKTNVGNGILELQNTVRQYAAHIHRKRKFTNDIGRGPGLKDFIITSHIQPVKCESVPYVRNASINGLSRKGNPSYPPVAISICHKIFHIIVMFSCTDIHQEI